MKKDDLKSLVTQMYQELLKNIDSQEKANKEQVISYLEDAIETIRKINEKDFDSLEHAKLTFSNSYKDIAKISLSSYEKTNGKFEKLGEMHKSVLEEAQDHLIDLPEISSKFNEIQLHILQEVAQANEVITKLSRQMREIEEDSNLDGLTKVFNRRALDKYLQKITTKKKLQHDLYLLLLDIDDFKKINDTFGHVVGDKILIFIANLLRNSLRDGDKVFRYGGEEFVIILNRLSLTKCEEIAKRILHTISTNTLFYKGDSVNVTISIGVTKYNNDDTAEMLINRADHALYTSKKQGKNQLSMEFENGD